MQDWQTMDRDHPPHQIMTDGTVLAEVMTDWRQPYADAKRSGWHEHRSD
jgi:hypothetical protein